MIIRREHLWILTAWMRHKQWQRRQTLRSSEDRFYTPPPPPPPPRGGGVYNILSQFWYSRGLKSDFQEVVVYRISTPSSYSSFGLPEGDERHQRVQHARPEGDWERKKQSLDFRSRGLLARGAAGGAAIIHVVLPVVLPILM